VKDGTVPNTTRQGDPKDVCLTYERYDTAEDAEAALKIGSQDPRGPRDSPTHRVTVDMKNAKLSYGGNGDTAGAIEIRTSEKRPAIAVEELEKRKLP
jgi:hypothetical protein